MRAGDWMAKPLGTPSAAPRSRSHHLDAALHEPLTISTAGAACSGRQRREHQRRRSQARANSMLFVHFDLSCSCSVAVVSIHSPAASCTSSRRTTSVSPTLVIFRSSGPGSCPAHLVQQVVDLDQRHRLALLHQAAHHAHGVQREAFQRLLAAVQFRRQQRALRRACCESRLSACVSFWLLKGRSRFLRVACGVNFFGSGSAAPAAWSGPLLLIHCCSSSCSDEPQAPARAAAQRGSGRPHFFASGARLALGRDFVRSR
jgi:hypothetical protein